MTGPIPHVAIRDWRPQTGMEPLLRVGVVLDRDARPAVRLEMHGLGCAIEGLPAAAAAPGSPAALEVALAGAALAVRINGGPVGTAHSIRLVCRQSASLQPGAGVVVRDVPAGRGFHWQKAIDQTLPGVIELRPGRSGVVLINELPLEDYLAGVIPAEMSGDCPPEFLKAQCVVARSWLLAFSERKHEREPFDRCNDDCCQRYQGSAGLTAAALDAVRTTRGLVLLAPGGGVLDANYSKCCGGVSESPRAVWGFDKPGLTPVVDAPAEASERRFLPLTETNLDDYLDGGWRAATGIYCGPNAVVPDGIGRYLGRVDQAGDYFRWTVRYSRPELEQLLREKLPETTGLAELRGVRVLARGVSGRATRLELEWRRADGRVAQTVLDSEYRIRQVLGRPFLYSSAFAARAERDAVGRLQSVTLRGAGWGHGVGMCQIGALGMALSGRDSESICRHYYPQAELARVY